MSAVTPGMVTGRTTSHPAASWPLIGMLTFLVFPLGLAALEWGRFGTDLAMWWPAAGIGVIHSRRRQPEYLGTSEQMVYAAGPHCGRI